MIWSDFAVTGSAAANNLKGFRFREDAVDLSVIEEVAARPGVKDAAPIYKNTVEDTDVTFEFGRNISFQEYTEESTVARMDLRESQVRALDGIDLEIEKGRFTDCREGQIPRSKLRGI